jgi:NAD(P)-dependent dehydrogenase (short-subunit alcohol dehydrogenase family)
MKVLEGKVAVVAGATRGAGRGIARALGEAGAIVYCTGRSVRGRPASGSRPETIEETAELVSSLGGLGIAVQVDHTVEEQVSVLCARVRAEQGRLDVLVNDIWGGDELTEFGTPFWELSLDKGRRMLEQAVVSHVVTSRHAAPLMIERRQGLIVEITDGDSYGYRGNLFYDLVKASVIRLAMAMAWELRRRNVTALALTPGFLRSESMLEGFGVTEDNWRDGARKDPNFIASESPLFVGRAVAALAADPEVGKRSGGVFSSWGLAREYGFTDADGSRPDWARQFEATYRRRLETFADAVDPRRFEGYLPLLFPDWP